MSEADELRHFARVATLDGRDSDARAFERIADSFDRRASPMTAPDKPEGLIAGGGEKAIRAAKRLATQTVTDPLRDYSPEEIMDLQADAVTVARALLSSPRVEGLEPVSYAVVGDDDAFRPLIEKAIQRDGTSLWKVSRAGAVLNKLGEWEYEPSPSNRDDDFLERCRFSTLADAADALRAILSPQGE